VRAQALWIRVTGRPPSEANCGNEFPRDRIPPSDGRHRLSDKSVSRMLQMLIAFVLSLAGGYGFREQMCRRRHGRHQFIVAILLAAAVPEYAHAQNLRANKDDAQKVVTIISSDSAKIQTYCDIKKLAKQVDQAYEKKGDKMADELSQKIDAMVETFGPEYATLIRGLQDNRLGAEFMSAVASPTGCARGKSQKSEGTLHRPQQTDCGYAAKLAWM
jgi:hypothetical protein